MSVGSDKESCRIRVWGSCTYCLGGSLWLQIPPRMVSGWILPASAQTLLSFLLAFQRGYVKLPPTLEGPQLGRQLQGPPLGGTAAPCGCGSTGRSLRSHTCQGHPTRPRVLRSDMEMTWLNKRVGSDGRRADLGEPMRSLLFRAPLWSPGFAQPGSEVGNISCRVRALLGPEAWLCFSGPTWLHHQEGHCFARFSQVLPPSTVQPKDSQATTTPQLGPGKRPSGSELEGLLTQDPHFMPKEDPGRPPIVQLS